MSNIKHILRLYSQNQTVSEIVVQTGIHRTTLKRIIKEFKESKLSFADINELNDSDLEDLFKKPEDNLGERLKILYSLFPEIDRELKRKGVSNTRTERARARFYSIFRNGKPGEYPL